jgi:hypothetical protein
MPDEGYRLRLDDAELLALILDRKNRDIVLSRPDSKEQSEGPEEEPAKDGPKEDESADDESGEEESGDGESSDATDDGTARPDDDGSSEPSGDDSGEGDDTEQADGSDTSATDPPKEPAFVDRQLQMAIDYLTEQLARAK